MSSPQTVTSQQADEIALKKIHEAKPEAEYVVLRQKTQEHAFGWVYFYAPKKYLETKDTKYMVPGAGPLVVMREGGNTLFLSTSVPPTVAISTFERQWEEKRNKP